MTQIINFVKHSYVIFSKSSQKSQPFRGTISCIIYKLKKRILVPTFELQIGCKIWDINKSWLNSYSISFIWLIPYLRPHTTTKKKRKLQVQFTTPSSAKQRVGILWIHSGYFIKNIIRLFSKLLNSFHPSLQWLFSPPCPLSSVSKYFFNLK